MSTRYVRGDWNAVCDVCGFKYKASQLRIRWDGLRACPKDWEPRQPQDFARAVPDEQGTPWARNEPADTFVTTVCTPQGRTAIPSYAIPGCAIPSLVMEF